MLDRKDQLSRIRKALARSPAVALLGPRQCGKTTLARCLETAGDSNYLDLENPTHLARLEQPMLALEGLRGLVVIDEVQRHPDLFPVLRVLCDRKPLRARFLLLGSASPELLRQSSESLAGRLEILTLSGFGLDEVGVESLDKHWRRGGFPRSFLARSEADSLAWRENFIRTVAERDLPQLGVTLPAPALIRFWTMLAHYHGQIWNAAEPARSLGVNETTVRRYLDLLTGVYLVRQLQPWYENLGKRQVKSPKIYFRDTGLLHLLLGIRTASDLMNNPKLGASWEGYAMEAVLGKIRPAEAYFWSTHNGAELDLLLFQSGKRIGVEFKRADAPTLTASMRIAMKDLSLDRLWVAYPGKTRYHLTEKIEAIPLTDLLGAPSRARP